MFTPAPEKDRRLTWDLVAGEDPDDLSQHQHNDDKAKPTAEDDDEDQPLGQTAILVLHLRVVLVASDLNIVHSLK